MIEIINLTGHELDKNVLIELEQRFGKVLVHIRKSTIYRNQHIFPQVEHLMKDFDHLLTGKNQPVIILPGLSIISAVLMAYVHGKCGTFPLIVELVRNNATREWRINNLHDLEAYRHQARRKSSV